MIKKRTGTTSLGNVLKSRQAFIFQRGIKEIKIETKRYIIIYHIKLSITLVQETFIQIFSINARVTGLMQISILLI